METFNRALLLEVLLNDPHDGLLHTLFQDVVLSRLVNFIQELFLALFVALCGLFARHGRVELLLEICLEHRVVLASERFDGDSALLAEIVRCSLRERPLD